MSINLGINHLRCIVAVADRQSFSAAALALDVAQSSLSRTVAEAERRLNVQLFTRTTRRVEVTGDGREVADHARRVLSGFDDGLRQIEQFVSGERGSVTVACLPSLAATLLPRYIVSFRERHPDVRVHIKDGLRDDVLAAVRAGTVDLAVVATSGRLAGLVQQPITTDSFYCAVPPNHRFAGSRVVNWAELSGEAFISFGPESSIGGHVRRALDDAHVELGPTVQAHNIGAVAGLTAAGLGITAVPELVLPMMSFAGLIDIPLEPTVRRTISLVQLEGRHQSASTREFIRTLTAAT